VAFHCGHELIQIAKVVSHPVLDNLNLNVVIAMDEDIAKRSRTSP